MSLVFNSGLRVVLSAEIRVAPAFASAVLIAEMTSQLPLLLPLVWTLF
jgi:hypothetical protein